MMFTISIDQCRLRTLSFVSRQSIMTRSSSEFVIQNEMPGNSLASCACRMSLCSAVFDKLVRPQMIMILDTRRKNDAMATASAPTISTSVIAII